MSVGAGKDKTKLTLLVDREVIEKAKAAGINISSITEQMLRVMTFEPSKEESYDQVVKSYENFLQALKQVLRQYNTWLQIGERSGFSRFNRNELVTERINLDGYAGLLIPEDEDEGIEAHQVSVKEVVNDLYPVGKILQDLLNQLIRVSEDSKDKSRELNFAVKFLKALSEEESVK
jgi:hypothetical protein